MRNPWFIAIALLALLCVGAYCFMVYRSNKAHRPKNIVKLAHTDVIKNLDAYADAKKWYKIWLIVAAVLFVASATCLTILTSRPTSLTVASQTYDNRTIMLCLDVSGSMFEYQKELLKYFDEISQELNGQKVGITLFDGISYLVAAPSNDYDSTSAIIADIVSRPDDYTLALYSAGLHGPSMIGDSTVGCINNIDHLGEEGQIQSVILATDNYANEEQKVSVTQAASYAKSKNVVMYGINFSDNGDLSEDYTPSNNEAREFRNAVVDTGGSYYSIRNRTSMTSDIVNHIMRQEASRSEGAPRPVVNDNPVVWGIAALVSIILLFIVLWRLKI